MGQISERLAHSVPGGEPPGTLFCPVHRESGSAAYAGLREPIVVERLRADAGLDIGLTLIGMHLKEVAVPVRLENGRVGQALVAAARTRPRYIGGLRAEYP